MVHLFAAAAEAQPQHVGTAHHHDRASASRRHARYRALELYQPLFSIMRAALPKIVHAAQTLQDVFSLGIVCSRSAAGVGKLRTFAVSTFTNGSGSSGRRRFYLFR